MADYSFTPKWDRAANGSVLVPNKYFSAVEPDLPLYGFWSQFVARTWGGVQISGAGNGAIFTMRYVQDITPVTTALSAGTKVGISTDTGIGSATGTIAEYGTAYGIENFAAWLSDVDIQGAAGAGLARHAFQSRNSIIGNVFVATSNRFECNGTGTLGSAVTGTCAAGTDGTHVILPYHVDQIVSTLRRKGIAPYPDGYYRCIGRPGAFASLKSAAQVYSSAASLGIDSLYHQGNLLTYGGVVFIEEMGQYAVTTWNGTASSSCIFGQNAVAGFDNIMRPDLITYYADDQNDFGRSGKVGWVGYAGYCRPVDAGANGRVWRIFHGV